MSLGDIRNLDYTILLCAKMQDTKEFYLDVMGFPLAHDSERWVSFQIGSALLTLRPRGPVEDLGVTPAGRRRIVSVKGGTFEGPKLRGTVLPGGGDWLVVRADGVRTLDVRITLRTEDEHLVYAHYPGLFHSPPDVAQRLTQGELVDPAEYYFRTAPLFETASDKYAWLNRILAVGIGRRMPGQVGYTVYAIL